LGRCPQQLKKRRGKEEKKVKQRAATPREGLGMGGEGFKEIERPRGQKKKVATQASERD